MVKNMIRFAALWALATGVQDVYSQAEHRLIRRLAVFPFQVETTWAASAEEAWVQVRDVISETRRFLVASTTFLQHKEVLQPRGEMEPAHVIIVGKIVDAHAILTTYLNDRTLTMSVYEVDYGRVLWSKSLDLQPSLPISAQLVPSSLKLVRDFLASVPYQGFVVKDPLKSGAVFKSEGRDLVYVDVGVNSDISDGDPVQIIEMHSERLTPIFQDGTSVQVIAEGVVQGRSREWLVVSLTRARNLKNLKDGAMVRLPNESKRLQELFIIRDALRSRIDPTFYSPEMTSTKQQEAEAKPLITSLTFIANIALFLLMAL